MKSNYSLQVGEKGRKRLETVQRLYGPQSKSFLDNSLPFKVNRVLDLGCGLGDTSRMLAEKVGPNGQVVAIDISQEQLIIAQQKSLHYKNIQYINLDISSEIILSIGHFDAIYGRLILTHIPNPEETLKRLVKILNPGGRLLLEEPMTSSCLSIPKNNYFDEHLALYLKHGTHNGFNYDFGQALLDIILKSDLYLENFFYSQNIIQDNELKEIVLQRTIECSESYLKNKFITEYKLQELIKGLKDFIAQKNTFISSAKMCQYVVKV